MTTPGPLLSVVVPTKNERDAAPTMLAALLDAVRDLPAEVIVVDDSRDGTAQILRELAAGAPHPISIYQRTCHAPSLYSAVCDGIGIAVGDWVAVIDADLQHPPTLLPAMLAAARSTGSDLAIASRYCESGRDGRAPGARRSASRLLAAAARTVAATSVSDPLSGYFLARRDAIDLRRLRGAGFKILFDILRTHKHITAVEIPFELGVRAGGQSKASLADVAALAGQLTRRPRPPAH